MTTPRLLQTIERLSKFNEVIEYHACLTGDCAHHGQGECYNAITELVSAREAVLLKALKVACEALTNTWPGSTYAIDVNAHNRHYLSKIAELLSGIE